jgi:hypothetical protein
VLHLLVIFPDNKNRRNTAMNAVCRLIEKTKVDVSLPSPINGVYTLEWLADMITVRRNEYAYSQYSNAFLKAFCLSKPETREKVYNKFDWDDLLSNSQHKLYNFFQSLKDDMECYRHVIEAKRVLLGGGRVGGKGLLMTQLTDQVLEYIGWKKDLCELPGPFVPEKAKLYCACRKPYDEKENYIGCDYCEDWCHYRCVGIEENRNLPKKWMCMACLDAKFSENESTSSSASTPTQHQKNQRSPQSSRKRANGNSANVLVRECQEGAGSSSSSQPCKKQRLAGESSSSFKKPVGASIYATREGIRGNHSGRDIQDIRGRAIHSGRGFMSVPTALSSRPRDTIDNAAAAAALVSLILPAIVADAMSDEEGAPPPPPRD